MTLAGLYVPLITPFDASGGVAYDALELLAGQVLDDGAQGLVALGTTGEPGSLSADEQQGVVDVIAGVCRQRHAPFVVGASTTASPPADAQAVLTLVPPFVRPGEDGVVAYFSAYARSSPVPVLVYHVPYRTGQPLSAATLRRIAALDNVAGVKLAAGGIDAETVALLADPPPDFAILAGDDAFLWPLLALGAHGGVLASAHVETAGFAAVVRAWRDGDVSGARAEGHRLARLALDLFAAPNPTVLKAVLHARGRIPTPAVRLPLVPPPPGAAEVALKSVK
ncbi:dihydrodipicolinate synthase family protein [Actinoplanes sp. NPDC049681]|uniref:dihydrodipicolinate synthase family protein n=1 Tax=Actinoplanes sp. NPDC049681 TaxID=3363905 RepID=UPI0037A0272C